MIEQINMFQEMEELLSPEQQRLRRALKRGSCFEYGKERILKNAKELSMNDFIDFLKKEYGIGGFSFEHGFVDFNSKGYEIRIDWTKKPIRYTWNIIAKEILDLINNNMYME